LIQINVYSKWLSFRIPRKEFGYKTFKFIRIQLLAILNCAQKYLNVKICCFWKKWLRYILILQQNN